MNIEKTTVQENGFEGAYYRDSEKNDRAMIINITFGGDSIFVKKLAQWLIENKTDALGITISGSKETGKNQSEIPLEYIESALNYLKNKGYSRVGILGLSLGASMSMLAASYFSELNPIISLSGFDTVFEGVNGMGTQYPSGHSSFTYKGQEIPFQPFHLTKDGYIKAMKDAKKKYGEPYGRMLWDNSLAQGVNEEALIPVEKIQGKLYLFGAKTDSCWDTVGAAERIKAKNNNCEVHAYEHGVHFILPECVPFINVMSAMAFKDYKTHKAECKAVRKDVTAQIERILKEWQ